MKYKLIFSKDYTDSPGEGEKGSFNGKDFLEGVLLPKLKEARKNKTALVVDFTGVINFTDSFLEHSFGKLIECKGISKENIATNLNFIRSEGTKDFVDRAISHIKRSIS